MDCPLKELSSIGMKNSKLRDLCQERIRIGWGAKKELQLVKNKLRKAIASSNRKSVHDIKDPIELIAGDIVHIKSKDEIKSLLDEKNASGGCVFTPEMYKYCGQQFRVHKRVDYFYDEVKAKMCKCKNLYLLEGAFCSGERRAFPNNCDRNCFLFWHSSWLIKVNQEAYSKR